MYQLNFYYGPAVALVPEIYRTKKEALATGGQWVRDCRESSRHKLTQVGSFRAGDEVVTLRIGGRQGYHVYGSAYISKVGG